MSTKHYRKTQGGAAHHIMRPSVAPTPRDRRGTSSTSHGTKGAPNTIRNGCVFVFAVKAARRIPTHYPQFPTGARNKSETDQTQRTKLKESLKAQRRSFFRLANKTEGRQINDFSVSLAAASCCSSGADPGVECVALKELRALRARILPSNRLLDALDLSRTNHIHEDIKYRNS